MEMRERERGRAGRRQTERGRVIPALLPSSPPRLPPLLCSILTPCAFRHMLSSVHVLRGGHRVAITVVVPRAYFWGPHRSICPASGRSVCPNGSKPWRDADGPREEAEDWEFWRHPGTWGLGPKPQLVRVYRVYSPSLHEFASSVSGPC